MRDYLQHADLSFPVRYHKFIEWLSKVTGMPDSLLHVHSGMLILVIARMVTRRTLGSFIPLAWVALAEAANEILDRLYFGSWNWDDTLSDIANTMFWPTIICLAVRLRPMIGRRR